jgi:hypothetical protein
MMPLRERLQQGHEAISVDFHTSLLVFSMAFGVAPTVA